MNYSQAIQKIADTITAQIHNMIKSKSYSDKTFTAKVTEIVNTSKCRVLYCGNTITVSTTIPVEIGNIVRVCAPCNNWKDLYVIENKTAGKTLNDIVNVINRNYKYVGDMLVINNTSQYFTNSPENTGTIKIKLPKLNFMFSSRVNVWSYNMCLNYTIGGYTYINTTSWYGVKAGVTGWSAEANRHGVRFASDSAGIRYILLGNTSTQWGGYLQVIIPEIIIGYGATPQISSGWEITLTTSENDLTVQGAPTLNQNI